MGMVEEVEDLHHLPIEGIGILSLGQVIVADILNDGLALPLILELNAVGISQLGKLQEFFQTLATKANPVVAPGFLAIGIVFDLLTASENEALIGSQRVAVVVDF